MKKQCYHYINTCHSINNKNHHYHHHIKPVNYASNEAMALEVVEEIKARTATNGMIAIIIIIIFEQIIITITLFYHNSSSLLLSITGGTAVAIKANIGNVQEIQAMFGKVINEV